MLAMIGEIGAQAALGRHLHLRYTGAPVRLAVLPGISADLLSGRISIPDFANLAAIAPGRARNMKRSAASPPRRTCSSPATPTRPTGTSRTSISRPAS
jgi:hypothetical protein